MAVHSTTIAPSNRAAVLGAVAGFALGASDWLVMSLLGVRISWSDYDLAPVVMGVFALTFAALGYAIGRLYEARGRLRRHADVIEQQMGALASSQARALQFEKLASIGRMAAGVAHEVRNPLAVIRSSASLLLDEQEQLDDRGRKACRFIHEETDRLDSFIRELLDFSRPIAPSAEVVAPQELLERVALLAAESSKQAGFALETAVDGSAASPVCVDPELLTRALLPLVINAGESAGQGGRVRLRAHQERSVFVVEVADDGPGIAADDVVAIFDPFVTKKVGGTGLGLPMADRIARALGGELEFRLGEGLGGDGAGACFRVTVPVDELGSAGLTANE